MQYPNALTLRRKQTERQMKNKVLVAVLAVVAVLLAAGAGYLWYNLEEQKKENEGMMELAELDKRDMEKEYQQFADQYSEMKTMINNDSIVAQLTAEQDRTQRLLEELKRVKSNDAREIARLKKELATVRAVLRSYVLEIDSLNRLNQNLAEENTRVRGQYEEATRRIEGLSTEKATLSEKVAIAAQLDAVAISLVPKDKRDKPAKKLSKCKALQLSFSLARNVTAQSGMKMIYVRVNTPTGSLLGGGGTFTYENRSLEYSMKKAVEYGGQETPVSMYWNVTQALAEGSYRVSIFADGNMIGSRTFSFE